MNLNIYGVSPNRPCALHVYNTLSFTLAWTEITILYSNLNITSRVILTTKKLKDHHKSSNVLSLKIDSIIMKCTVNLYVTIPQQKFKETQTCKFWDVSCIALPASAPYSSLCLPSSKYTGCWGPAAPCLDEDDATLVDALAEALLASGPSDGEEEVCVMFSKDSLKVTRLLPGVKLV